MIARFPFLTKLWHIVILDWYDVANPVGSSMLFCRRQINRMKVTHVTVIYKYNVYIIYNLFTSVLELPLKWALGRGFDPHLEHSGSCSCNSEVRVRVLWLNILCRTTFCPAGVMPYDEISVAIVYFPPQELCTWWSRMKVIPSPLGTVWNGWFWVWWMWTRCKLYFAQQELGGRWRSKTKEIPLGTVGVGDFTYLYTCIMFV